MIGIITVFYSENCGSVLQAYALSAYLNQLGFRTQFILTKSKYSSHSLKYLFLRMGKQMLKGNIRGAKGAWNRYIFFHHLIRKNFPYIRWESPDAENLETFILGSDTVWDVERGNFLDLPDVFWPRKAGKKVIAYGTSVANSTVEQIRNLKYPEESLQMLKAISVRDQHTMNVISSLTDRPVKMVCDPTLLVNRDTFDCFMRPFDRNNCIVLYLFEVPDTLTIQQICLFARKKKCRLVSIGKQFKWCDEVVEATVDNFITYFSNAEFIISNTFHGAVFSIIYEKRFVSLAASKKKVVNFLEELNLADHLHEEEKNDISDILNQKVDYFKVNRIIMELRKESQEYLKVNLNIRE